MHAKIALSWQEKRVYVGPIRREILILARNPDSCKISGFRKGFRATGMPISCHESARGVIGIQKCRFLAKRRSANAFLNRLRRSEERNAAAFIPPLFNGTEEREKASPFATRFTPTRAATRWRVSPPHPAFAVPSPRQRHRLRPRLRLAFTFLPAPHSQAGVPPACTRQFSAYDKMTIA